MSAFDKVIGYEGVKAELSRICDMVTNPLFYRNVGAKLPQGVLLYGAPGLGKSLMAQCFIEESGLPAYTLRKTGSGEAFLTEIRTTFSRAAENAPSIIFLDDMDKFANEDEDHRDAEEYVTIQAKIDEVKGKRVFLIATANDMSKLPASLVRSGRFDRHIRFDRPDFKDAEKIICHFLRDKKISADLNMDDLTRMISYSSCADLESLLNDAAVNAAFRRRDCIEMEDMVDAVLRAEYGVPTDFKKGISDAVRLAAMHEAGHVVMSEALHPGSVGFAYCSHRDSGKEGFVHLWNVPEDDTENILIGLAGKAAVELYYGGRTGNGCEGDFRKAATVIDRNMERNGDCGLGLFTGSEYGFGEKSESLTARTEAVRTAELERYMQDVRKILCRNYAFLERTADELRKREYLLHSDIQRIRKSVPFVPRWCLCGREVLSLDGIE